MCKIIIIVASCLSCPVFSERPLLPFEMSVWPAASLGIRREYQVHKKNHEEKCAPLASGADTN